MPTCPNCGTIIMEGDPYCSHCGSHLQWNMGGDSNDSFTAYDRNALLKEEYEYYDKEMIKEEAYKYELLVRFENTYDVELVKVNPKGSYAEYEFVGETPYYTLKLTATDQYGGVIGLIRDSVSYDFTKLIKNRDFIRLIKDMDVKAIGGNITTHEIFVYTEDKAYRLDTDKMKLEEEKNNSV